MCEIYLLYALSLTIVGAAIGSVIGTALGYILSYLWDEFL